MERLILNKYHVAYFIHSDEGPKLSGLTIQAESISDAELKFHIESDWKVKRNQIKYIIKLN